MSVTGDLGVGPVLSPGRTRRSFSAVRLAEWEAALRAELARRQREPGRPTATIPRAG